MTRVAAIKADNYAEQVVEQAMQELIKHAGSRVKRTCSDYPSAGSHFDNLFSGSDCDNA